ncbi:MAG: class II aldolase/adducin family protein [Elusimicrobiota bacterium]
MNEKTLKKQIILSSKKLKNSGMLPGASGNISIRFKDKIFITPSMVNKEDLKLADISEIDLTGKILNSKKPSSEYQLHINIYKIRKDINAIVHTHPPYTIAYSIAKIKPDYRLTVEFNLIVKNLKFCPFEKPGSTKLALKVAEYLKDSNAVVMENHGLVSIGSDLTSAMIINEEVENFFKINYLVKTLKMMK